MDDVRVELELDPSWSLDGFNDENSEPFQSIKLEVYGYSPIAYSELVRELLSLPSVQG